MNTYKPRRPAQLKADQVELIEGSHDIAQASELAHTTAAVVVPLRSEGELEADVRERVLAVIAEEGIDTLAETWASSPAQSLPGILWRGYLLREWIRRFEQEVSLRFEAAHQAGVASESDASLVPDPQTVKEEWDTVFAGAYEGDFMKVLRDSARFTDFLGRIEPEWISSDEHPLATPVTRRDTAMLQTSRELRDAGELYLRH